MRRRAHFAVEGRNFDGKKTASVVVEQDGPHTLLRVRPSRHRREFVLPLADVAERVIWAVVRAEVDRDSERSPVRRVRRGRLS